MSDEKAAVFLYCGINKWLSQPKTVATTTKHPILCRMQYTYSQHTHTHTQPDEYGKQRKSLHRFANQNDDDKKRRNQEAREKKREREKNQFCLTLVKRMASLLNIHWSYNPSLSCSVVLLSMILPPMIRLPLLCSLPFVLFYVRPRVCNACFFFLSASADVHLSTHCDDSLICCSRLSIPRHSKTARLMNIEHSHYIKHVTG